MTTWSDALAAAAVVALVAAPARAELRRADPVLAPSAGRADATVVSTLYLDRCVGGCVVHGGQVEDAATNTSTIPPTGAYHLQAFGFGDAEWAQILRCVQDVYSPYAVTVTDVAPAAGVAYDEALVAGLPTDVGLDANTLGIALLAGDCHPLSDAIAFAFANAHPHDATFVDNVCWTVAQESAHLFGLDHEYVFTDGVSACSDPMTYRGDCGGEKFFRPQEAYCGRVTQEPCRCSAAQSSHRLLLARFGPATPTTAAPVVTLTAPTTPGPIAAGAQVVAHASAQRGIARVDLLVNGAAWASVPGVAFGAAGQAAADYTLALPDAVPDGILDVAVAARDDLGVTTTTPAVTMTKGAPCASAATCAADQVCDAGRCRWDPPTGALGDACAYAQSCVSGLCVDGACTAACDVLDATSCPAEFACASAGSGTAGTCARLPATGGGCCDAGGDPAGGLVLAAFWIARGRRRRRGRTLGA